MLRAALGWVLWLGIGLAIAVILPLVVVFGVVGMKRRQQ